MRTEQMPSKAAATALLFVLALAPLRAETPTLSAPEACQQLEAQARRLLAEKVRCEAGPSGLILRDVSSSGLKALQRKLFPAQRYLGYAIVPGHAQPSQTTTGPSQTVVQRQATQLQAASMRLKDSPAMAQAVDANFDNSVSRHDLALGPDTDAWGLLTRKAAVVAGAAGAVVLMQGGPPGSDDDGPPGSNDGPPGSNDGPPGSNDGPPGSNDGPPGSDDGPPGSGNPPGGSAPPSRPAPVWRSSFPPPPPNWWNTDFDHYDWWNSLPSGYDRPYRDQSNPDSFLYYSGWYRWRDVFTTNWERTEDSASIRRTPANQQQVQSISLTSQVHRESKECYYQAVYRYDWAQGGFYGSHWEEHFDRYKARCIRLPTEYGQPRVYTTNVSFDLNLVQGQDLPWESDVIRVSYNGQGQPRYDFSGAAYHYTPRLDAQRSGSESVTLVAGTKKPRAPESDKVQAFLRVNAGRIELVINDDRASYYQGETLRVNARIVRRVVTKTKGRFWGWNEKNVDSVIYSQPLDILVGANNPQSVTDLTGPASAPKPANAVSSTVFIDSWEFSRVNSRISTDAVIRRGQGNSVSN